jgi:hypothetical protein
VLELIDATVSYPPGKQAPVVDVTVVNRGGQTAVIKRVQVTIVRTAGWPDWSRPFAIRPRSFYGEGAFSPRGGVWQPGYGGGPLVTSAQFQPQVPDPFDPVNTINLPVAHQVPAGEADRFDIVLSMPPRRVCHVDLLKLVLLYDSDSREVKLPPVAVVSTQFPDAIPPEEVASGLLQFEKEIKTVDAARASAGADAETLQGMVLTEDYYAPNAAIEANLYELERHYRDITEILKAAPVRLNVLGAALPVLERTLSALPDLRDAHTNRADNTG